MDNNNVIGFLGRPRAAPGNADARQWLADFHAWWSSPRPHRGLDGSIRTGTTEAVAQRSTKAAYVVRVDLDGARPPIWRRLRLASDITLNRLHEIIQIAMGWTISTCTTS